MQHRIYFDIPMFYDNSLNKNIREDEYHRKAWSLKWCPDEEYYYLLSDDIHLPKAFKRWDITDITGE